MSWNLLWHVIKQDIPAMFLNFSFSKKAPQIWQNRWKLKPKTLQQQSWKNNLQNVHLKIISTQCDSRREQLLIVFLTRFSYVWKKVSNDA